jgi:hypothetical protein
MCFANVRLTVHTFSNYIIAQLVGNFNPSRIIIRMRSEITHMREVGAALFVFPKSDFDLNFTLKNR